MKHYILHLETATKSCSVAVSVNGQLITFVESADENFEHGEKLTLYIEKALQDADIAPDQLSAISLSAGPGSYTGLRIGCSTAKGMCFGLKIPLIAIDSLTCIALNAIKDFPNQRLISLIDARRMEAFTQAFDADLKPLSEIEATILDESTFETFDPFIAIGDGAEKLKEIWADRNLEISSKNYSSAVGQCELAYEKFTAQSFEDVAYFEPLYLKDFVVNKPKKTE